MSLVSYGTAGSSPSTFISPEYDEYCPQLGAVPSSTTPTLPTKSSAFVGAELLSATSLQLSFSLSQSQSVQVNALQAVQDLNGDTYSLRTPITLQVNQSMPSGLLDLGQHESLCPNYEQMATQFAPYMVMWKEYSPDVIQAYLNAVLSQNLTMFIETGGTNRTRSSVRPSILLFSRFCSSLTSFALVEYFNRPYGRRYY